MGCISSAPVEPEGDEFEGDPLADLKRRKRDLEQEVKGAQEYGQALLASQAELLQAQAQKEEDRKKYYREHAFLWRAVEVCQRRGAEADHVIGVGPSSLTDFDGPPQEGVLPIVLLPVCFLLRLGLQELGLRREQRLAVLLGALDFLL